MDDIQLAKLVIPMHLILIAAIVGFAVVNGDGAILDIRAGNRSGIQVDRISRNHTAVFSKSFFLNVPDNACAGSIIGLIVVVAVHIDRTLSDDEVTFELGCTAHRGSSPPA